MKKSVALVSLLIATIVRVSSPLNQRSSVTDEELVSLTKLIRSGNIAAAQQAARVNPPLFYVDSYAHYLTVNDEYNSNIFFWYFPVTSGDTDAPLILWMQGGPGTSSLLGLFAEHGPVSIDSKLNPVPRLRAWNKRYNIVYFDNPVGAGFSYTDNEKGYARNMDDVASNLYEALLQFLSLFPNLQKKPFFITGESYAGKYIPALGHYIHLNNPKASLKVNLSGIAIGNGLSDPPSMLDFSNHFYQTGLIDQHGKVQFDLGENEIKADLLRGDNDAAFHTGSRLLSLFKNLTGFTNIYNYLYQDEPVRYWIDYVQQPQIKKALHVYERAYSYGSVVKEHLTEEFFTSVKSWVEELLETYRVLIYSGQLDCAIPPKQVHDYLKKLVFPGLNSIFSWSIQYHLSHRAKWMVGDMIGGYVKTGGLLTELVVRNAGHMVPMDQPELGWDLIDRFVNNKKFSDLP